MLISNVRAKLTDFGMARLGDVNPQATRFTNTMCPGTDVYMPPEAVQDKPVYTEKIDCFSFGVIAVQTLTREFPRPGERQIAINDPRYPRPIKISIPEIERRQSHICRVNPNHPLLSIALDCLKDADGERPSAQQLCDRVAALKVADKYKNACEDGRYHEGVCEQLRQQLTQCRERLSQLIQRRNRRHYRQIQKLERDKQQIERERDQAIEEKERELRRLNQQLERSEVLQYIIDLRDATIAEKEQQLRHCREETTQQIQRQSRQIQQLERDKRQVEQERDQAIEEKERRLGRVNQQLEESERLIADFGKQNTELEEELSMLRSQKQGKHVGAKAGAVSKTDFNLRWREGEKAPCKMVRSCDPVVGSNTVYCKYGVNKVYSYHIPSSNWSPVTIWPTKGFAFTVIGGLLTTVGGYGDGKATNKLYSLIDEESGRKWTKKFSPMPTRRYNVSALYTGTAMIVAGGWGHGDKEGALKTVEVLNTETQQWHTSADLPQPLSYSSITLCGDLVYLLGGVDKDDVATNSVYSCSLTSLLSSTGSTSLGKRLISALTRSIRGSPWSRVADLPVKLSTAVTLHGRLLAIGGKDSNDKATAAIHMYLPTTNSWEVISHMNIPRSGCLSAVLPNDQLMIVGGWTNGHRRATDSVEFGTVF